MSKFEVLKIKSRIRTKFWIHFYELHLIVQCNLNINSIRKMIKHPYSISTREDKTGISRALAGLEHLLLQ